MLLRHQNNLLDGLILTLFAYLAHQTMYVWFMEYNFFGGSPQLQLGIFMVITAIIILRLWIQHEMMPYFLAWRENWMVALFLVLALLSVFWSVSLAATLYRAMLLLMVTFLGAYFGLRFSARSLVNYIAIVVGVFALTSLFLALFFPTVGIHPSYPYLGLWRGVFWHKIYLGAMMALGYPAYLVIIFSPREKVTLLQRALAGATLILCVTLAVLSDSASGLVVLVIQTGLFAVVSCWLTWGHLLSRRVYGWVGGTMALGILLVIANLEFFFGLFNRTGNMTGRVPMWLHLLDTYVVQRPLFGHGFGAFWMQQGIMQAVRDFVGWEYSVRVSDNGYLDILLGVGLVGLLLLLIMLATGFWRAIRQALRSRDLVSFFPLFLLVHILFINISLSYFFENETFLCFLLVVILFMLSPRPQASSAQNAV